MRTLHVSRASMAATVTGAAEARSTWPSPIAKSSVQFGRPLSAFQVLRHRLVDMQMRVDASRLMVQRLAELIAAGEPCRREAAQAKGGVVASEALAMSRDPSWHADARERRLRGTSDMQRLWRDGRLYSFGEGANELLRDLVARDLGLRSE